MYRMQIFVSLIRLKLIHSYRNICPVTRQKAIRNKRITCVLNIAKSFAFLSRIDELINVNGCSWKSCHHPRSTISIGKARINAERAECFTSDPVTLSNETLLFISISNPAINNDKIARRFDTRADIRSRIKSDLQRDGGREKERGGDS